MVSLVIMAAGMGTRYKGGIKQLASVGPNSETIMELSVNDAINIGFDEIIFILREELYPEFMESVGRRLPRDVTTRIVFQKVDDLPVEYRNYKREKPWGTGHAVLSLKTINNPFVVINADDYYGYDTLKKIYEYLNKQDINTYNYCMAGFKLKNTLSPSGGVSRGICTVDNNYLTDITETYNIEEDTDIDMDSVTSMNLWGFTPTILRELNQYFEPFIVENHDTEKEFMLPEVIKQIIKEKKVNVKVIPTTDKWYGLTYIEDLDYVKQQLGGKVCLKSRM